jgi:rubrerythrin
MSTQDNLKAAFAGERQANRTYLAFAKKADKDGLKMVARLFRGAAAAETVHAHAHLRVLGGVKETTDNLKAAIEGEGHEFTEMYPEFVEEAKAEGNKDAQRSFELAMAVEKIHHGLYEKALETVEAGGDLPEDKIFVCGYCGNTVFGEAPEKCPICGAPRSQFFEVE